jgi:hypothetical protein
VKKLLEKVTEVEELLEKKTHFEILKKNKVKLTDEERDSVMKGKAVWHHGPDGAESPAVWKSVNREGKNTFVASTHRCYKTASTVKGAIHHYHNGVKQSA